jgi:hypothetical protein
MLEEGVPRGLLDQELVEEMLDRPVVKAQLRPVVLQKAPVGRRIRAFVPVVQRPLFARALLAPGRGLHGLLQ